MLKEIVLSASILLNGFAHGQNISATQNNSSYNDSLLIELLSKDYIIQDTTINGVLPFQRQRYESYEKLKENYSHPERVDILTEHMMDTTSYSGTEHMARVDSLLEEMLTSNSGDSLTTFLIGECYKKRGNTEEADKYYEKAIQQGLKNSLVYQYVADFRLSNLSPKDMGGLVFRQTRELIPLYQKAIELDPQNKAAHYHLAEVYSLINMHVEAFSTLNKTFEIHPTEITDYLHRMMIMERDIFKKEDMSEELKKAIKKRYLRDVDISSKRTPILLHTTYIQMGDSKIFTEQDIKDFEKKYYSSLQPFLIQDNPAQ